MENDVEQLVQLPQDRKEPPWNFYIVQGFIQRNSLTCDLFNFVNFHQILADNYTFDIVSEYVHLGSAFTTNNDVSVEIKRKITLAKLNRQLSWKDLFRMTKVIFCDMLFSAICFFMALHS